MDDTRNFKLRAGVLCAAVAFAFAAVALVAPQQAHAAYENNDILLGDFFQSDADTSNSIYASYDGKEMYRIAQAYKGASQSHGYDGDHYAQYDPSIIAWGGKFWSLSGWQRNDGKIWVMISYSSDLVNWTYPEAGTGNDTNLFDGTRGIPVNVQPSHMSGNFDTVAPEWTVTKDGLYITVSCGYYGSWHGEATHDYMQVYTAKVTELSAEAPKWGQYPYKLRFQCETAQRLNFSGDANANYIDGSLYSEGDTNYLVVKRGGLWNDLYANKSMDPNGWYLVKENFAAEGYEGASMTKLNGTYFLYGDHVVGADADGVKKFTSSNLVNGWSGAQDPKFLTKRGGTALPARHGTVITLKHGTAEWKIAKKLLDKQVPQPKKSNLWKRLYGGSALTTMKSIVNTGWSKSDWAIVATNKSYHDALSASGLAGVLNAPVLMSDPKSLSNVTKNLLKNKKVKNVIVAGGTAAISKNVENQIKKLNIKVTRVAGGTAATTSRAMYKEGLKHGGWGKDAVVATSDTFQDALSIAPYAYAKKAPIFLTDLKKKTLNNTAIKQIKKGGFTRTLIVGGTAAVKSSVDKQVVKAKRLAGGSCYTTSKSVARFCLSNGMTATHMGVATGRTYQDALCGAALCGKNNSILVLADDKNSKNADSVVKPNKSKLKKWCYVFGGEVAVSVEVWNAIVTAGGNK